MSIPETLRELHRLHKHLRNLKAEIEQGPRVMKATQAQLEADRQAHADAHDTLKKQKLKQKDDEGTLKATEVRLAKLQADLNTAGSKKEFDAKTSEIEQATAKKGELEDAILETLADIEERTAALPGVEQRWKDAQAEFERFKADAADRLARMQADQTATQARLGEVEAILPPDVKPLYARLVKSYGADGLAAVVGKACQQCRSNLTDQQRTTLLSGKFQACPSCGRALYLAEG
jgi:predicted  nucleic acid-binding Zn-ribbon protein